MSFEVFTKQRSPLPDEPYVTIQKKGIFALNAAAFQALGSPEAVELLYDRERRLVAFRATAPDSPYAYGVRPNGPNARSYLVSGRAFVRFYEIALDTARRWPAELADGMLTIDLRKAGTEVRAGAGWG